MRVIAGTHGGRRLKAPPGRDTRPTSDRVREALFSSLAPQLPGARVLDLYAGSGALGIEALSRGADIAVFVERHAGALRVIRDNLTTLELAGEVVAADVADAAERVGDLGPYDLVLADPPYGAPLAGLVQALERLRDAGALEPGATVVVERDRRAAGAFPAWLDPRRRRTYGDTVLHVLQVDREVNGP